MNAFKRLYRQRLQSAHKPFLARGITVKRCAACLLAETYCVCQYLRACPIDLNFDLVLLMHRDEILKPTNTGRLLAEAFPNNCFAFEWSRLEPDQELIRILESPTRQCAIIYPAKQMRESLCVSSLDLSAHSNVTGSQTKKRPTFLLLDGTWRQAARMFNHSQWLKRVPLVTLPEPEKGSYTVRKSNDSARLSTAEAVVLLLQYCKQVKSAEHLSHIFTVFNRHCSATRACIDVEKTSSHEYLLSTD